jgi:hypothetical protein
MRLIPSGKTRKLSGIMLTVGGVVLAVTTTPAFAIPSEFTPGDLVVYETLGTSHAAQEVDLVDYSVSSTPVTGTTTATPGYSVSLPIADSGTTHALTESGSALNDGELTLSADGQDLEATGYDAVPGYMGGVSITGTTVPRTVAIVSQTGVVDTTTSLSDTTTEGQNFRSATQVVGGSAGKGIIWTGGGAGVGITGDGATSDTYLKSDKVHEVQVFNGNLYESTATGINQVGSGLPTAGTPTDTDLLGGTGGTVPANFGPDQFAFVNLGTGAGPDTLYVADGSNGATAGEPNCVEKYSLESSVWTATGSICDPTSAETGTFPTSSGVNVPWLPVGLAADVTLNASGQKVANIFVTGATTETAANNTVLAGFTDSSGYEGTLSGTFTQLATAPTGDDFKGLAFAPATVLPNNGDTPETPLALLLPIAGGAILVGGVFLISRRRRNVVPSAAR